MIKNYPPFILAALILFAGCKRTTDEVIQREIKVREARRGRELISVDAKYDKNKSDTIAVYYTAKVKSHDRDSTISDSLFFIKMEGTLLPFLTSKQ